MESRKLILSQLHAEEKADELNPHFPFRLDEGMWDNEDLIIQIGSSCTKQGQSVLETGNLYKRGLSFPYKTEGCRETRQPSMQRIRRIA